MKKKIKKKAFISKIRSSIRIIWRALHPSKHTEYAWEELKKHFSQYDDDLLYFDDDKELLYAPTHERYKCVGLHVRVRALYPHTIYFTADFMMNLNDLNIDELNYVLSKINFGILYGRVHIVQHEDPIKAYYIDEIGTDTIALYPERIRRFAEHFDQLTFEVAAAISRISNDRKENDVVIHRYLDQLCRIYPPQFDW